MITAAIVSTSVLSPKTLGLMGPSGAESSPLMDAEFERAAKLRAQEGLAAARLQQRQQIINEVIAGRLSLTHAASRFLRLNKSTPECMTALRSYYPGMPDEQRVCEQVIYAVRLVLEDRGEPSDEMEKRLRAELRDLLDRPEGLSLPEAKD
jgi:hypothetical protein